MTDRPGAGGSRPLTGREGLFISYARSDGKDFAARLREKLEREGVKCWQDVVGMEGGRDWWGQIQDAVRQVEFLVLVMTPAAMQSATVRKEWRYARQQGVCVYPVIAAPPAEFAALVDDLPNWMRSAHFYNLGLDLDHLEAGMNWVKFLNDLRTSCTVPRVPFMADDLGVYIPRSAEYDALVDLLLDADRDEPKAITSALALKGAGGYGKTTLARAICHDERIQEAFDDGVLWVTLGESATMDTVRAQIDSLITVLDGQRFDAPSLEAAKTRLRELMADRDMLLVIDDVWNADHAKPFLQGGERVARLITTRDGDTLPAGARRVNVNAMTGSEALDLLVYGLPAESAAAARPALAKLASDLMEYPLPLKLANGILRDRVVEKNQPLDKALAYVRDLLDEFGLELGSRQSVIDAALRASLDQLDAKELTAYKRLAIFPDDADVPLDALQMLWDARPVTVENLCDRLEKLSLLLRFDPASETIRLHDVIRDFLLRQAGSLMPRGGMVGDFRAGVAQSILISDLEMYLQMGGGVIGWQREFLDRYRMPGPVMGVKMVRENRKPIKTWADLWDSELYLWDALAYHLIEAAMGDELITTVLDLRYLAKKTVVRGTAKVEADLEAAELFARRNNRPQLPALSLLTRQYRSMTHLLARCDSANDAAVALYTRLSHVDALKPSCDAVEATLGHPYITRWYDLPDLPHPALIRTLTGHTGFVTSGTYSPDGSRIVSASWDNTVRVWDGETGQALLTLSGHTSNVTSAAYSPDGSRIVSASWDKTVRIWDGETGEGLLTLTGHTGFVDSAAYSPDGRHIVSASQDKTVRVWDGETGEALLTLTGHTSNVNSAAYSPDGRHIVSASWDKTIRVWDGETGEALLTLTGHTSSVNSTVYSPDGRRIISASRDKMVRVWDGETGEALLTLPGHTGGVSSAAYSPDGLRVISASWDKTIRIWEGETGKVLLTLIGHTHGVISAAYSPDGLRVISASWDKTIRIWDGEKGEGLLTLSGHTSNVTSAAYSPDGRRIVTASADETIRVWDGEKGEGLLTLSGHTSNVTSAVYSPDGRRIITASADETIRVWDGEKGEGLLTLSGRTSNVTSAAYSPDGKRIVSASRDKMVRVWDGETGEALLTLTGHTDGVNSVVYSPDGGRIVTASGDNTVRLWDGETGEALLTLTGHTAGVVSAAYSPDGKRIVSASWDKTVRIWDGETGKTLLTLTGHTDFVNSAACSPDGANVVSTSSDQTLRVWDAKTGLCLAVFRADAPLFCCAWSPDGKHIVAGGNGGYLYWLRWVE